MDMVVKNPIMLIGGLGPLIVLICVIWRLLRSLESISEREYLVMRILFAGGICLTILSVIFINKMH